MAISERAFMDARDSAMNGFLRRMEENFGPLDQSTRARLCVAFGAGFEQGFIFLSDQEDAFLRTVPLIPIQFTPVRSPVKPA